MDGKRKFLTRRMTATITCIFMVALLAYSASIFGLLAPKALQEALTRTLQPEGGPVIRIDKQGYVAGEAVRIAGSGFAPYERVMLQVTHANGTAEPGAGHESFFVNAGPNGAFTASWQMGSGDTAGAAFVISAAGASSGKARATFSRQARMNIDGTGYKIGDKIRISGDGFNPKENVLLDLDGHNVGAVMSDANGRVSAEIELPNDPTVTSFLLTATGAISETVSALAIPLGWVTVIDQQGANDYPGQDDLTFFARNDDDTSVYRVRWGWDSTDVWTGTGQTGNACALFDTDGDGKINFVVCGEVQNPNHDPSQVVQTAGSPFAFTCNNAKVDRCGTPSPVSYTSADIQAGVMNSLAASPPGNLIAATDPFSAGDKYPNDTVLELKIRKGFLPPGAALTNVCSYPSAGNGGNNNPFDCIAFPGEQGPGFLVIKKDAGGDTTTDFLFDVSPVPPGEPASYTIKGGGSTSTIGLMQSTPTSVTEELPLGWFLNGASCKLENGTPTGTLTQNTISNITIVSGKITTCIFANGTLPPGISVLKENDANHNGSFSQVEAVSLTATYPYTVTYKLTIQNEGGAGIINSIVDNKTNVLADTSTISPACKDVIGQNIGAGQTVTCYYDVVFNSADSGTVTNTVNVNVGNTTASNSSSVHFDAVSLIDLVKIAAPSFSNPPKLNDKITYTLKIYNNGNSTLTNVLLTDALVGWTNVSCGSTTLAPAASTTCTANYQLKQTDLNNGYVTNLGTACAATPNNTQLCDNASVSTPIAQVKSLTLKKTDSAVFSNPPKPGDTINYLFTITNTGTVTFTAAPSLTDLLVGYNSVTCGAAGLLPGESTTCSASYTITQVDVDSGHVQNTGQACSFVGTVCGSSTVDTTIPQVKSLTVVKTAATSFSNPPKPGDTINYSFQINNTGNVTLTGLEMTDALIGYTNVSVASSLAASASTTATASYTITQADIDAGHVLNSATVCGNIGTVCGSGQVDTPITQTKSMSLVKSVQESTYTAAGNILHYSYTLTNTGNTTISGPFTVTDNKATVNCPATPSLAPGASITCTASYTVTQADLDSGSVTNLATGHATGVDSNQASKTVNATQNPALSLEKTATESAYANVGDVLHYNYKLTNSGNITLSGPFTVSDNKTTVSCPATATLAPGNSITCTATYTVTQGDLDSGSVTNLATGHSSTVDSNQASKTVNATQNPALTIAKSATESTYEAVGDVLHYSYTLTNSGNVTLSGPFTVNDNKTTVSCPATATLAPGSSITCTASYTVTQADLDSGSVTNIANGHASFNSSPVNSSDATVTVKGTQKPAISIKKTASASSLDTVGATVSYSFLVTNTGNITITSFTISDPHAGLSAISCPVSSLAPGAFTTCTATYTDTQADMDAGKINNTATVNGSTATAGPVSATDSATVTLIQKPGMSITKSAAESTYVAAGDVLHYTYTLKNTGNVTLSGPFTVSDNKTTVSCPATATLAPAATITCTAAYAVTQADLDGGSVTNIASGHASFGSSAVNTDNASVTVKATQKPAVSLKKTASATSLDTVGATITYSFAVTNTGNVTITTFSITDPHAGLSSITCPVTSLAPNATTTCTATYIVKQSDMDLGSINNTATVNGSTPAGPVSATDSATVTLIQKPGVNLLKTGAYIGSNPTKVGDKISYSFKVSNTGNVTITSTGLTDALIAYSNVSCGAAPLAPSASTTCSGLYSVTQADIDSGAVLNSATVCSVPNACGSSSVINTLYQNPHLSLTKTADTDYYTAGQVIHYTLVAKNDGNTTLTNVSITDTKLSVLTCTPPQPTTLAPGGSLTCTGSYTTTNADMVAGSITNVATATATGPQSSNATLTIPATVITPVQWMTGGGTIGNKLATHGMILHCSTTALPNNLQINWDGKKNNSLNDFHLENQTPLSEVTCFIDKSLDSSTPNNNQFNTICGTGTGNFNGTSNGATVYFKFTDAGEPGKNDFAQIIIPAPGTTVTVNVTGTPDNGHCSLDVSGATPTFLLNVSGTLTQGNQQAH